MKAYEIIIFIILNFFIFLSTVQSKYIFVSFCCTVHGFWNLELHTSRSGEQRKTL